MSNNRDVIPSQGGVLRDLLMKVKLIGRLMADRRVSPWIKLLPIGAVIYVISPVDLIMGIPGLDAVDDLAVLWLGTTLFIELCPSEVVAELSADLAKGAATADSAGDVIDADVTDVSSHQRP